MEVIHKKHPIINYWTDHILKNCFILKQVTCRDDRKIFPSTTLLFLSLKILSYSIAIYSYNFHHHLCVDVSPHYRIKKSRIFNLTLRLYPSFSRPVVLVWLFVVFLEIHVRQPPWTLDDLWQCFAMYVLFPRDFFTLPGHIIVWWLRAQTWVWLSTSRCMTFLSLSFSHQLSWD